MINLQIEKVICTHFFLERDCVWVCWMKSSEVLTFTRGYKYDHHVLNSQLCWANCLRPPRCNFYSFVTRMGCCVRPIVVAYNIEQYLKHCIMFNFRSPILFNRKFWLVVREKIYLRKVTQLSIRLTTSINPLNLSIKFHIELTKNN